MRLHEIGSLTAVVLAEVFVVSAIGKLRSRDATVEAFMAFRLPAPRGLAVAVPVGELLIALVLIVRPWLGALLSLATLTAFSVLLAVEIRNGSTTPCRCFGGTSSAPVSFVELIRNAMLAAAALPAVFVDRLRAPSLLEFVAVLAAVVVANVLLIYAARVRDRRAAS